MVVSQHSEKINCGRSMEFSADTISRFNLLFKRHGQSQDVYFQFYNTHFSFCLYSSCQRHLFENPGCFKLKMADFPSFNIFFLAKQMRFSDTRKTRKKYTRFSHSHTIEGVSGVNRLATKGKKILPTTDKTRKKLSTTDRKIINRLPTWTDIIYIFFRKKSILYFFYLSRK